MKKQLGKLISVCLLFSFSTNCLSSTKYTPPTLAPLSFHTNAHAETTNGESLLECSSEEISEPRALSLKNKEYKQIQALEEILHSRYSARELNSKALSVFKSCWSALLEKQTHDSGAASDYTSIQVHVSQPDNTLRFSTPHGNFIVAGKNGKLAKSIGKTIKKIVKLYPNSQELEAYLWQLWTLSLIKASGEKYNHYIFADQMEIERAMVDGRTFSVGFRPKFAENKIFVGEILDPKLGSLNIEPGAEIIEIASEEIHSAISTDWWTQEVPFTYEVTFKDLKPLSLESIPFIIDSTFCTYWNNIAYIRIHYFNRRTAIELSRFFRSLRDETSGIVIDVRNNGGGYVSPGVIDFFLKPSELVLVYEQSQDEAPNRYFGSVSYVPQPIVVLQNNDSASMSEILAAMLQKQGRAKIVGTRSFGKAVGQQAVPVNDEGVLHLVDANYYYPDGKNNWADQGIVPDINVSPNKNEVLAIASIINSNNIEIDTLIDIDSSLQMALEILGE